MSAVSEMQVVRGAAARAGCKVLRMGIGPDGHARGQVQCDNGWQAARLLLALCEADRGTPWVQATAATLRASAPADYAFVAYVHTIVRTRIRFERERGEIFAGPEVTWNAAVGDCDDHARLVYALLSAGGVPVRLAFLYRDGDENAGPRHVVVQAFYDGTWHWLETTVAANVGEFPYDAAARLGLMKSRSDIARKVMFMSGKDLPPIPKGFDSRTSPEALASDVQALSQLGFLCDASGIDAPDDPRFRVAVQTAQRAMGVPADGLIGPATRHAMGRLLPWYETMIGEVTGLTSYLSDAFFARLREWCQENQADGMGATAEDFLAVWLSESGCNPARKGNPPFDDDAHGAFGGLNMMNAQARAGVGFTGSLDAWVSLPDVDQLEFVLRFYEVNVGAFCGGSWICLADLGALYLMNFLPAMMGHANDPGFVLASAADDPHGWYANNRAIDVGAKGFIEVADMQRFASRVMVGPKWDELRERAAEAGPADASGGGVSAISLLFLGAAAAGLWWVTRS